MPYRRPAALLLAAGLLTSCAIVTSPADVTPDVYVGDPVVAPDARDAFGAGPVEDAWDEITSFALETSFQERLVDPRESSYTPEELTRGVVPRMTPDAGEGWSQLVAAALGGSTQAQEDVQLLTLFQVDAPGSRVPGNGQVVSSQAITDGKIGLVAATSDTPARLAVSFRQSATLTYEEADTPYGLAARKTMTFQLEPAPGTGDPGWLIAEYEGDLQLDLEE
ncbi:hypothetical protein [Georgenia sp. AZ-5]|uniref:hypothetical protein n=1 Tax=Georgenia sp. AZ-5 TaxID=3367526 RepID=UPI0037540DC7